MYSTKIVLAMIFSEIKCHVNTCLGLVGGMHPLHPPCVRACICTGGAPTMIGVKSGFATLG